MQQNDLISDDISELEDLNEDYDQRLDDCAKRIIMCFREVSHQFDIYVAWDLFSEFVRLSRPKLKKGPHNPEYDAALLSAYDTSPPRKRKAAILAVGQKYRGKSVKPESIWRHLRRLLKARKLVKALFERWRKSGKG